MTGQTTGAGAQVHDLDPAPDHDVRAVLRITPFRRLWIALGLSSLGDWLGLLAIIELAKQLAGSSVSGQLFAVSGVLLLRVAPAILLGPVAGVVADRLNRRFTLVAGDLLRFALFVSIILVGTMQWLYIATVLIECVALFWGPAKDAAVPNLVPRHRLEAANRLSLVATYGTAPIAAGLFILMALIADAIRDYTTWAVTAALWVNAISFLISGLVIWRLPVSFTPGGDHPASEHEGESLWRSAVDGYRFVMATPVIRGLVLGMLGAFAAGGFVVGLASSFVHNLGAGQAGFGVLFGAVFIGLALGMWLGPRFLTQLSRRRLFGLSLSAAGLFLVLLALVPDMALAAIFTVGLGFCAGLAWVTGYTLLGLEVDDEMRGRTFSFVQSGTRVVLVVALAAGPALAALMDGYVSDLPPGLRLINSGPAWVFLISGVIALVMGATAYRQMGDHHGSSLRSLLGGLVSHHPATPTPAAAPRRPYPGFLIAFEGGDGTGKSTQARVLADWLRSEQGHDVVLTREPGATAIGVRLREVLLGDGESVGGRAETLLFAADRAHHVDSLVRPALARGAIVITDRYVDSSIAYQGGGRGMSVDDVAYISRWATGGLEPDLTVLLDIPPEIARVRRQNDPKRNGADKLEAQPDEFHAQVREAFLSLARQNPQHYLVIDGSDQRDDIQAAIRRRVRDIVPISRKRRAELAARLAAEEEARIRRAAAEAEVLRLDAELRGRSRDAALARQEETRKAREEADRMLQEEAERQIREQARLAALAAARTPSSPSASATSGVPEQEESVDTETLVVPITAALSARAKGLLPPRTGDVSDESEPTPPTVRKPGAKAKGGSKSGGSRPTGPSGSSGSSAAENTEPGSAEAPVAAAAPETPVASSAQAEATQPVEPARDALDALTGPAPKRRRQGGHALSVPGRAWFVDGVDEGTMQWDEHLLSHPTVERSSASSTPLVASLASPQSPSSVRTAQPPSSSNSGPQSLQVVPEDRGDDLRVERREVATPEPREVTPVALPQRHAPVLHSVDGADDPTGPIDLTMLPPMAMSFVMSRVDDHSAVYDTTGYEPVSAEALGEYVHPGDLEVLVDQPYDQAYDVMDDESLAEPEYEPERQIDLRDELFGWGR